jgi:hypothetical protein
MVLYNLFIIRNSFYERETWSPFYTD